MHLVNTRAVISPCNVVRDLKILIDSQKFHDQITAITKKTNHLVAINHKAFQHFIKAIFINLCKTYIRPVLEFGNVMHFGSTTGWESTEKSNQSLQDCTYDNCLAQLHLPSLKYRRQYMIKIYQLWTTIWMCILQICFSVDCNIISNNFRLFKPWTSLGWDLTVRTIND